MIGARHIHVSLRDQDGKSLFAVSESELKTGRANAQYEDTKFLSQEGEWFLAGILEGLPDGTSRDCGLQNVPDNFVQTLVLPMVSSLPASPEVYC